MIQIRFRMPCRREFQRDVYRPGVISLSRILWGSAGGGLLLGIIALASRATGVGVLFPPLAATCFIAAACAYLRVARPKQVIVGHFVSMVGGLLAMVAGPYLVSAPEPLLAVKLGLAVLFAAVLMQVFDADHPPAAATAAIPVILPLPADPWAMPLHMAWGATLAVLLAFAWNRAWFEYPAAEGEACGRWCGLAMDRGEGAGVGACILGFGLMSLKPLSEWLYEAGLVAMLLGVCGLMLYHFLAVEVVTSEGSPEPARR